MSNTPKTPYSGIEKHMRKRWKLLKNNENTRQNNETTMKTTENLCQALCWNFEQLKVGIGTRLRPIKALM